MLILGGAAAFSCVGSHLAEQRLLCKLTSNWILYFFNETSNLLRDGVNLERT